ncbi:hypothetical protein Pcinc_037317 [Petrolisthes cinctipes]|uniref:Uncharacterized protein n=1 Tax=Petrolisthes cinctipes TaxID=88211 RepID=A0AAE1BT40_PETCI|nr:hypothetical protein Pcinc_037317 [Petrolisthes cinctipes]
MLRREPDYPPYASFHAATELGDRCELVPVRPAHRRVSTEWSQLKSKVRREVQESEKRRASKERVSGDESKGKVRRGESTKRVTGDESKQPTSLALCPGVRGGESVARPATSRLVSESLRGDLTDDPNSQARAVPVIISTITTLPPYLGRTAGAFPGARSSSLLHLKASNSSVRCRVLVSCPLSKYS